MKTRQSQSEHTKSKLVSLDAWRRDGSSAGNSVDPPKPLFSLAKLPQQTTDGERFNHVIFLR